MINIFISYRRNDAAYPAAMLYDRMKSRFGVEHVFMDVDSIPPGVDFREHIQHWVNQCDVFLVIIGNEWLSSTFESGKKKGRRRLSDKDDVVRIEIEAALQRQIPVIPVLVEQAQVPKARDLPPQLRHLSFRNAVEIRSGRDIQGQIDRFLKDLDRLSEYQKHFPKRSPSKRIIDVSAGTEKISSKIKKTRSERSIINADKYSQDKDLYSSNNAIHANGLVASEEKEHKQLAQRLYDLLITPYPEDRSRRSKIKILIVDDEEFILLALQGAILDEFTDATVELAKDGIEALEKNEKTPFDIIFSDIWMQRMDGIEFLKTVNKKYPNIPVVLFTGHSSVDSAAIDECPHIAFFLKPFRLEEMFSIIYTVFCCYQLIEFSMDTFPDGFRTYRNLLSSYLAIHRFLHLYQSNNLFETAIRHKIKDSVRGFCSEVSNDVSRSYDLSFILSSRLIQLEALMKQIQHGSKVGFAKILKGIKEDINCDRPGVDVEISSLNKLPSPVAGGDIETFLAFSVLEFTDNALDAIENRGKIRISLRKRQMNNMLVLAVWDDGPMISSDLAEKIFEEGVTTKGQGRGMGLHIIKSLCHRFGGKVELTQDDGVRFAVLLPLGI